MDHDPLCPSLNEKIWVLPPYDGECACERYAAVRADEREKAAQKVEQYGKDTHPSHAPNYGCQRCDIHAAYNTAADIVRGKL